MWCIKSYSHFFPCMFLFTWPPKEELTWLICPKSICVLSYQVVTWIQYRLLHFCLLLKTTSPNQYTSHFVVHPWITWQMGSLLQCRLFSVSFMVPQKCQPYFFKKGVLTVSQYKKNTSETNFICLEGARLNVIGCKIVSYSYH